ncbi:hypothetical protein [uncultured Aquimarina sp.]|uniref:hypothetical protein n=1 Tax=uncultured Aquimarina sp. TaxID=575652 RepID=UPI00261E7700|nr:hypothetical protein [uncultured Aquimarina sp.]
MKAKRKKILSLDKIKIAKLDNIHTFKGGIRRVPNPTDPEICNSHPLVCWVSISTKTAALSNKPACFTK